MGTVRYTAASSVMKIDRSLCDVRHRFGGFMAHGVEASTSDSTWIKQFTKEVAAFAPVFSKH